MMYPPEELYGIIGHPLGHSLSPQVFTALFAYAKHRAAYFRWDIAPEKLPDFLAAVRTLHICGVSVTIPHKEAVIPYLDKLSARAQMAKAVNTLYWEGDQLCGENMDIAGFLAPLENISCTKALILGYGGAARAVLAGLHERKIPVLLSGRSEQKAKPLLRDFEAEFIPWQERTHLHGQHIDLLVNATPLGMQGSLEKETPFPSFADCETPGLAYDLVYRPRPTRFLQEAAAAGWQTQDGLAMFQNQAIAQFQLWTGAENREELLQETGAILYPEENND